MKKFEFYKWKNIFWLNIKLDQIDVVNKCLMNNKQI